MLPLSRSLEQQVLALCARPAPYRIEAAPCDPGPSTFDDLLASVESIRCERTGALIGQRIQVWSGASDRTIWSSPEMNHLFRAWHDSVHILLDAEFDPRGERRVSEYQCAMIDGAAERAVLWAETEGQQGYRARWGSYPADQRSFVRDCIVYGLATTIDRGIYH